MILRKLVVMNWSEKFAARTACMRRSAIRELLKFGNRPGMISLAGGLPAAETFQVEALRKASDAVLSQYGRKALQYGETEGLAELRDWIAGRFSTAGMTLQRDNVLITTGAQQGLDLLGRVLLDSGDEVIVENPTYLAALTAWRPIGVEFLAAPTDECGLLVDALEALLPRKPKLLYAQPNFQNPTGITLTEDRRATLAELSRVTNLPVIEDDPYGELWFDHEPPRSLFQRAGTASANGLESGVAYLGTFSKILAPALRVGWVIAEEALIDKLALAKQAADLQSSTFNQYLALEMTQRGLERSIPQLREVYRSRRDAMLEAMEKHFPREAMWTRPLGGLFVWVVLPAHLNATELLPRAVESNVTFVPGEDFHCDGGGKNTMRLNFSNASEESIRAGIERLGGVIRRAVQGGQGAASEAQTASPSLRA